MCFGSILPDIDSPKSYINRKYLLGIGKGIALFSKHRGFWHSIYGILIFIIASVIIVYIINVPLIFSLALPFGYFLHLAADSLNTTGIKWLWKSNKLHIKSKIKTGKITEQLFFIALLLATIYLIIGNQGMQDITAFMSNINLKT